MALAAKRSTDSIPNGAAGWNLLGKIAQRANRPRQAIEDYNREDCESTVFLHDWLLKLRREQGLPEQPLQLPLNDADQEPREPQPLELLSQELLAETPMHTELTRRDHRVPGSPLRSREHAAQLQSAPVGIGSRPRAGF